MYIRLLLSLYCCLLLTHTYAQQQTELSVERIMQDPRVSVGTSPSDVFWSEDGKFLYFQWNPDANPSDSLYMIAASGGQPELVPASVRHNLPQEGAYSSDFTEKVYSKQGDIYLYDIRSGNTQAITQTLSTESQPFFSYDNQQVLYTRDENLFAWNKATGKTQQLTDFRKGKEEEKKQDSPQEQWLQQQQLFLSEVLRQRKEKRESEEAAEKDRQPRRPLPVYVGDHMVKDIGISHQGRYITYALQQNPDAKTTLVPNYVTESGFTEDISARAKVGSPFVVHEAWIYDTELDTAYQIKTESLPGLQDLPDYAEDYADYKDTTSRLVYTHAPVWSSDGQQALLTFRSADNKDRWIGLLQPATGDVKLLDRQRDEAWIAGPGIEHVLSEGAVGWMPDQEHIWMQSEDTGYAHLYLINIHSGKKKALTQGNFEVYNPRLSRDKKWWYFEANCQDPGIQHIYKMPAYGGDLVQLTTMEGGYQSYLSPDEKHIAFLFSTASQPWELYVMDNKAGAEASRLTHSTTEIFSAYAWRTPAYVTFKAEDGATVHARLYRPEEPSANGPAVIFVHGAGYLQNAHRWWSRYYREYMFHNLLADRGYTVLDIDYRGSAGYGRDWRTGIYRHMGGKDLSDQVDGAKFLVEAYDVDPERIGIYGGSYGGFITLMAMFTQPEVFAAGAALRSVTDWAHYNHGYTSNILNTPATDSLAFARSSPVYYAEGLQGALLICHGMVDTNVHFQGVVRLVQRLIELKKENWELAVYPVEDHAFTEPSSWTDEYRRILKLFEENLR